MLSTHFICRSDISPVHISQIIRMKLSQNCNSDPSFNNNANSCHWWNNHLCPLYLVWEATSYFSALYCYCTTHPVCSSSSISPMSLSVTSRPLLWHATWKIIIFLCPVRSVCHLSRGADEAAPSWPSLPQHHSTVLNRIRRILHCQILWYQWHL